MNIVRNAHSVVAIAPSFRADQTYPALVASAYLVVEMESRHESLLTVITWLPPTHHMRVILKPHPLPVSLTADLTSSPGAVD